MPKTNWLGRLSAHLWMLGNRGWGKSSCGLQLRQRRGGPRYSTNPAMIEVLEPRRMLSVANDDSYQCYGNSGSPLTVDSASGVLNNDSYDTSGGYGTSLTVDVQYGSLSFNSDGSFNYSAESGYYGADSFTYRVDDGGGSDEATVTIDVMRAGTILVGAHDDSYSCYGNSSTPLTVDAPGVLANDESYEMGSGPGSGLTVDHIESDVQHGTLDWSPDGSFVYTPEAGFGGTDSFAYVVTDGTLTAIGNVSITVVENFPPSLDEQISFTPLGNGDGTIAGTVVDATPTADFYVVEMRGGLDRTANADLSFDGLPVTLAGSHSIELRAVGYKNGFSDPNETGDWQDFEIPNTNPVFPQSAQTNIDVFSSTVDELPAAIDLECDTLTYTLSPVPGATFNSSTRTLTIVDQAAFRSAIADGDTYTLTATDPYGGTGTMTVRFTLAAGSTVTGTVQATPDLVENTTWSNATTTSVLSILGDTTLNVSAVTRTSPSGGLMFTAAPTVDAQWSAGSVTGRPDWHVRSSPPGVVSVTTAPTPDGMNETITVTVRQIVEIRDLTVVPSDPPLVARISYDVFLTISTDGMVTRGVGGVGWVVTTAYTAIPVSRRVGYWGWLYGISSLTLNVSVYQ